MDDPAIVQKDEIVIVLSAWLPLTHKRDASVALLPDCLRCFSARQ
jgi:hypothetical protein